VLSLPRLGSDRPVAAPAPAPPPPREPVAVRGPTVPATRPIVADLRAALPGWVLARVLVAITLLTARQLTGYLRPLPEPVERHVREGLLGWDAQRYVQLAEQGYAALPRVELRFFPLLPLAVRALDTVLPGGAGVALLLLANLAALAFGMLVHRLALVERGDPALARRAAWFAACFPAGFVLVWGYSEAPFLALTAGAFLALRRRRWWVVAALGIAIGLLRPVGLLFAVPVAIEVVHPLRGGGARLGARHLAALVAAPAGTAAFLGWVGLRFGDPFLPFTIQQSPAFRGAPEDPLHAWWASVRSLAGGTVTPESLRAVWVLLVLALLVHAVRHWRPTLTVYAAVVVLVALSTSRLGSFERYGFCSVPMILALASLSKRPSTERALLGAGAAAMTVLGLLALVGAYTP
jgi:hypothetical protein